MQHMVLIQEIKVLQMELLEVGILVRFSLEDIMQDLTGTLIIHQDLLDMKQIGLLIISLI